MCPNSLSYFFRGECKNKLKDYQGAIDDYSISLQLDSLSPIALNGRGQAKFKLKDYQGAVDDYSKAIELNPADKFKKKLLQSRSEAYKLLSEIDLNNSQN